MNQRKAKQLRRSLQIIGINPQERTYEIANEKIVEREITLPGVDPSTGKPKTIIVQEVHRTIIGTGGRRAYRELKRGQHETTLNIMTRRRNEQAA